MELCVPFILKGGCDVVFVMPNTQVFQPISLSNHTSISGILQPPITQVSQAIAYHEELSRLAPDVNFLMSLFLHPTIDKDVIAEAAQSIHGASGAQSPRQTSAKSLAGQIISSWGAS